MAIVHLTGSLAKYSRKPIKIDAPDTLMLMQGLVCMFGPKFKQQIRDGQWHITRKRVKDCVIDDSLAPEELSFKLRDDTELWISPVVRANSAILRIILGVVLLAVAFFYPGLAPAVVSFLEAAGASLILGGVVQLLTGKPKIAGQAAQAGQNVSFIFNGTVNVTEQGGPVPIVYGRVNRASSLVLSAGMTTENIPPDTASTPAASSGRGSQTRP